MYSGDFVNMSMVEISDANYSSSLWHLFGNLAEDLPVHSVAARILPKDTLTWKLKLVESAAAYANSRLHAITAEVLVLARFPSSLIMQIKVQFSHVPRATFVDI
ncbi:hypothetical protein HanPSC8_Chr13g0580681 [Helianthus annuus]|nr:hypothetical protein HanPSC8_Chr13g0580681 [Helianthus annuus]